MEEVFRGETFDETGFQGEGRVYLSSFLHHVHVHYWMRPFGFKRWDSRFWSLSVRNKLLIGIESVFKAILVFLFRCSIDIYVHVIS